MRCDLPVNEKQATHDPLMIELLKHTKTSISAFGLFLTSHKKKYNLCEVESQSRNETNQKINNIALRVWYGLQVLDNERLWSQYSKLWYEKIIKPEITNICA